MNAIVSPAEQWMREIVVLGGDLDEALAGLTTVELAALAYDWPEWWARPCQLPPDGPWRSFGLMTGRRFGKTDACAHVVHAEAISGRAMRVGLIAQTEQRVLEDMIEGVSGILAAAPPWERPEWVRGRLLWPNGAQGQVFTPEKPQDIRGPGLHLGWASEIRAWPRTKIDEAWRNFRLMISLGYARLLWDTTPTRRHAVIRQLLWRAKQHPERHVVVTGGTRDNVLNINPDELAEWESDWGGTTKGREELDGEFIDDTDGALVRQEWIDKARRSMPLRLARRIIIVDPAISMRENTDPTGMAEMGLGLDDQIYLIDDMTGRVPWEEWARVACERYRDSRCDCLVIERNRGGDACVGVVRAWARMQRPAWQVVVVKSEARTIHQHGTVTVKEVIGRESKEARLEPVAVLYEKGRISHVDGAPLEDAEEELTSWEPDAGMRSPNRIDAIVHGAWELAGLGHDKRRAAVAFVGLDVVRAAMKAQAPAQIVSPLSGAMRGGRSLSRL